MIENTTTKVITVVARVEDNVFAAVAGRVLDECDEESCLVVPVVLCRTELTLVAVTGVYRNMISWARGREEEFARISRLKFTIHGEMMRGKDLTKPHQYRVAISVGVDKDLEIRPKYMVMSVDKVQDYIMQQLVNNENFHLHAYV